MHVAYILRSCEQALTRSPAASMLCNSHNARACVGSATRYAFARWDFLVFGFGRMAYTRIGSPAHYAPALCEAHC